MEHRFLPEAQPILRVQVGRLCIFFSSLLRGIFETQGVRVPRAANSVTAFSPGDWSVEIRRGNGVDVIGRELAAVQVLMKNQTRKRETKRFQRASEKRGGEESRRKQKEREREKERKKRNV